MTVLFHKTALVNFPMATTVQLWFTFVAWLKLKGQYILTSFLSFCISSWETLLIGEGTSFLLLFFVSFTGEEETAVASVVEVGSRFSTLRKEKWPKLEFAQNIKVNLFTEWTFLHRGFSYLQSENPLFLHFPRPFFKIFFVKVRAS